MRASRERGTTWGGPSLGPELPCATRLSASERGDQLQLSSCKFVLSGSHKGNK